MDPNEVLGFQKNKNMQSLPIGLKQYCCLAFLKVALECHRRVVLPGLPRLETMKQSTMADLSRGATPPLQSPLESFSACIHQNSLGRRLLEAECFLRLLAAQIFSALPQFAFVLLKGAGSLLFGISLGERLRGSTCFPRRSPVGTNVSRI